MYCANIEEKIGTSLPRHIVKLTVECTTINVSVHDQVRKLLGKDATAPLGRLFHLSVKSPEDGAYQPSEGDICHIRLHDVKRLVSKGDSIATGVDLETITNRTCAISCHSLFAPDPPVHIRSQCREFFTGHGQRECLKPLTCGNCLELGHGERPQDGRLPQG